MKLRTLVTTALTMCILVTGACRLPLYAQTSTVPPAQSTVAGNTLTVATKPTPPFAMKTTNGGWTGLAIDLMQEIARKVDKKIEWLEVETTQDLLRAVEEKRAEASIAAITVTSERERSVDFSHAYYDSGLAIAVPRQHGGSFWAGLEALTSPAFLGTVGMLFALLLVTGAIVWLTETRRNPEQFERNPIRGIGSGFWWAAVTMTTVGYGDKAPITPLGRVIAVVWMFAALILTAVFTAQLTTALTLDRLSGPVSGFRDLARSRVGVVERTASIDFFNARAIRTLPFASIASGLTALEAGEIDAFVHDEPILRYDVNRNHQSKIEILPEIFDAQVYAIAMPSGSRLREPLNQALLDVLATQRWSDIRSKYFGRSPDSR